MRDKKIALVNPSYSNYLYGSEREIKNIHPPLNLLYLHSFIRNIANVMLFDGEDYNTINSLVRDIENFQPEIVGITATSPSYPVAKTLAMKLRSKTRLLVIGGAYATVAPDEVLEYFDIAVIGEGELAFKKIISGEEYKSIHGIAFKRDNDIIFTNTSPCRANLDILPFPSWDLVDFSKYKYSIHRGRNKKSAPIITSRGCPYSCRYCSTHLINGKIVRTRSPSNVGKEMDDLINNYGIRHFHIWDDTFTFDKHRLRNLCREIQSRKITFSCNTRPDVFSESDGELLAKAGCTNIFFGVESANKKICEYYRRKVSRNLIIKSFNVCTKFGIKTTASFMIGAPYETERTLKETLNFASTLKPDFVLFNILTPHKGTEIYLQAISEGLLEPYEVDLERYPQEPVGIPTMKNINLNRSDLQTWKINLYRNYYSGRYLINQFVKSINQRDYEPMQTALKLWRIYRK